MERRVSAPAVFVIVAACAIPAAAQDSPCNIYWGDLHAHTSYSLDAYLAGNRMGPDVAFQYARDVAQLDFVAITDHAEWISDEQWLAHQGFSNSYNEPGRFVTFIGFEFTLPGNPVGGGHKCVIFKDTQVTPRPIGCAAGFGPEQLWAELAPYECITVPHHPAKGSGTGGAMVMGTDWDYVNADKQPMVEIYSIHGSSEAAEAEAGSELEPVRDFQWDRSVDAALDRWLASPHDPGYKLGIGASTDNHLSRPGSVMEDPANAVPLEGPTTGGLVAVMAAEKTRAAIYEAIKAKRTYGSTGARIGLSFTASMDATTVPMGNTLAITEPTSITFTARAVGDTAAMEKIQLIRNGVVIAEQSGDSLVYTETVSDWSYYRVKAFQQPTARWDGATLPERAWSSPIWIENHATGPSITTAVSRKTHGSTGTFDIDIMNRDAVECRMGGPTEIIAIFDMPIEGRNGLDPSDVSLSSGQLADLFITRQGHELTLRLNDVQDGAPLTIAFPGLQTVGSHRPVESRLCFRVLAGDVTCDGVVNIQDLAAINRARAWIVGPSSFRNDVNTDGAVNLVDAKICKQDLGRASASGSP